MYVCVFYPPRYAAGASGSVVYPVASVGVVLDPLNWTQRFQRDHSGDILALAVSPDRRVVATSQLGARPTVLVWDSETCETLASLAGFHKRAVTQLAFDSEDGALLATLGADADHSIAVYDWQQRELRARARSATRTRCSGSRSGCARTGAR